MDASTGAADLAVRARLHGRGHLGRERHLETGAKRTKSGTIAPYRV
jgi:hypothetical protein